MTGRVVIFSNGVLSANFLTELKSNDYIIGVDAAALWLIKNNLVPHLAIGDFDSVTAEEFKIIKNKVKQIKKYSSNKDYTDLHLAINFSLEKNPKQIIIFGARGTRLDHTLVNLFLLELALKKGILVKLKDVNNEMWLVNSVCLIKKSKDYKYLSILSYSQESVISILGCKYEVKEKKISRKETIGISNEVIARLGKVMVYKGIVIVVRSRD